MRPNNTVSPDMIEILDRRRLDMRVLKKANHIQVSVITPIRIKNSLVIMVLPLSFYQPQPF